MARTMLNLFEYLNEKYPLWTTLEELETAEFESNMVRLLKDKGFLESTRTEAEDNWKYRMMPLAFQFLFQGRMDNAIKEMKNHTKETKTIISDFKKTSEKSASITTTMTWIVIAIGILTLILATIQAIPILKSFL